MWEAFRWAPVLALAVLSLSASHSGGEEARAATRGAAEDARPDASGNTLLGALSFTSSQEPISLSADALEFDYRKRVLTYKGGVVVTQGDMTLQSETLTVALDVSADNRADNRIKEVVADGQVRLSQGSRWATGGRAVFDQTRHTVVLSQNAELHDGPNQVTGNRVVVYLDQERSVVEGGSGRVKAVLFPPKETTPKGAALAGEAAERTAAEGAAALGAPRNKP